MARSAAALLDQLGGSGNLRLGSIPAVPIPLLSSGVAPLDRALGGGLPRGRVTELSGARSSGRTGLAGRMVAAATRAGETIAWIDPEDALDPEGAMAAGVVLARTLWVRPRDGEQAARATEIVLGAGGFGLVVLDLGTRTTVPPSRALWPRLAHAAERSGATLLVSTPRPTVGATAALGLTLTGRRVGWSGGAGRVVLLEGIDSRVAVTRSRQGRSGTTLVVRQACA